MIAARSSTVGVCRSRTILETGRVVSRRRKLSSVPHFENPVFRSDIRQHWKNVATSNAWKAPVVLGGAWSLTHASAGCSTAYCDAMATLPPENTAVVQIGDKNIVLNPENRATLRQQIHRYWRMLKRMVKLAFTLAPVVAFYPILFLLNDREKKEEDAHDVVLFGHYEDDVKGLLGWYLRLCLACAEHSGAAVIKLMQWAGSRPDLFGHDFCSVFSKLQDNTTPHPWRHTERLLKDAYGDGWHERIQLEKKVIGSGCIGQVYRGKVKDKNGNTKDVAVKVLHPSVEDDIDADLDLMRATVRLANRLPIDFFKNLRWLNMEGVVEEFAGLLKLQMDLRKEAENLEKFQQNFAKDPAIVFPKVVDGYQASKYVLVEEFCDGVPIVQFCRDNVHNQKRLREMCHTAIAAVCKMIFLDNFVHGDLHPGNVFVSRDGNKFILFDVGIVNEYAEEDHKLLIDVLAAFIRKQGRKAGRLMIDDSNCKLMALKGGDHALEEEKYIDKIEKLTIRASTKGYLMEHLGTYITYICNAAAQHHVMMNPAFVSAALAVKVQEGIALAMDPSVQIPKVAIPIIVEGERRRFAKSGFSGMKEMLGFGDHAKTAHKA